MLEPKSPMSLCTDRDRSLARLATGLLVISFAAIGGLLLFVGVIFSQRLFSHPEVIAALVAGVTPFAFSAYALTKVGNGTAAKPRRLWLISLSANVVIITLAAAALGPRLGATVYIPALLGVLIHVIALTRKGLA